MNALTFNGRPTYVDVVATLASLAAERLANLQLVFTRDQYAALEREMTALMRTDQSARTKLCGFPIVLTH